MYINKGQTLNILLVMPSRPNIFAFSCINSMLGSQGKGALVVCRSTNQDLSISPSHAVYTIQNNMPRLIHVILRVALNLTWIWPGWKGVGEGGMGDHQESFIHLPHDLLGDARHSSNLNSIIKHIHSAPLRVERQKGSSRPGGREWCGCVYKVS